MFENSEDVQRILNDGQLPQSIDVDAEIKKNHREWSATEGALEIIDRGVDRELTNLSMEYCKSKPVKEKHDADFKRLFAALLDVHEIHSQISDSRRQLIDSGIKLHGIYMLMPAVDEVLGNAFASHNPLADLFRAGAAASFCKLSAEYKL
jgi:hypothetical protein